MAQDASGEVTFVDIETKRPLSQQELQRLIDAPPFSVDLRPLIASDRDVVNLTRAQIAGYHHSCHHHEHRFRGGPPSRRLKRMQLSHEMRARQAGVHWDTIDLRLVYQHHHGMCGICEQPVSIDEFTIDHIIPISKGGPHLFDNLQLAHRSCNSAKGDR